MSAGLGQTVIDGSLVLAVPVAALAGLVSFASPCVLPLVPGYLGYVTGLTGADLEEQRRFRLVAGVGLFVLGFSAVFVTAGWLAGAAGGALQAHREGLSQALGVLTVLLGLVFAGFVPKLAGSRQPDVRPVAGLLGAPLLGVVFGLSWTPCVGPTLAAILSLAGAFADPARGALLATAYCAGLGVPFLLAALAYRRAMRAFGVLRRHRVAVNRAGGLLLVLIGVLLISGAWGQLVTHVQGLITNYTPAV
jgi:cytochrome c-type biogenesis protein